MDLALHSWRYATPPAASYPRTPSFTPTPATHGEPASASPGVLMRVLDQLDYGVMIVTDKARVRFANRAALRECTSTHAVQLADGHLHARDEREQSGLMHALAASRSGRRTLLTFASHQPLLSVAIVPVHEAAACPAADPTALVVLGRRRVCEPLSVDFFAREHHLTGAETAVLRGLAGGLPPAQIALDAGVAMSTVRTQITSIRLKTGARSIADLVRLVTVLPPIVPVLTD